VVVFFVSSFALVSALSPEEEDWVGSASVLVPSSSLVVFVSAELCVSFSFS